MNNIDKYFQYHPEISRNYQDLVGGVIFASELNCTNPRSEFDELYQAEQSKILNRYIDQPLSEILSIQAWRRAFRAFGVNPTKYRSASEALLRRLMKKGQIPQINLLVDIANLVAIRYALPVAVFDVRKLSPPLLVHYADGSEWFTPLGENDPEHPLENEVIFSDMTRVVSARRWCWRQSYESMANAQTQTAIITVEAQHPGGITDVSAAVEDLETLLTRYTSGQCSHAILSASIPN